MQTIVNIILWFIAVSDDIDKMVTNDYRNKNISVIPIPSEIPMWYKTIPMWYNKVKP
jgi:hypothetical protein